MTAILDTNVILDIVSCHDVLDGYEKDQPEAWFRLERAGYALRLAIYLHQVGGITLSAGDEALTLAQRLVPPKPVTLESWFLMTFFWFTKPKVLRRWRNGTEKIDGKGTAVDNALIALAARMGRPLVSNEGIGPNGPNANKGIRVKAPQSNVEVFTSEEFCKRHPLSRRRWKRFLDDFARVGPAFHRGRPTHSEAQRALAGIFDYYKLLLRGTEPDAVADRELRRKQLTQE